MSPHPLINKVRAARSKLSHWALVPGVALMCSPVFAALPTMPTPGTDMNGNAVKTWPQSGFPSAIIDPQLVGEVLDVIKELARTGTTLVIVTHEIGFAREVADTVVFMEQGRVVESYHGRIPPETWDRIAELL